MNKQTKKQDKNNWKTEWIKKLGGEMVQSLLTPFNRIEEKKLPTQWRETKVKSLSKGANRERIQENHTGMFQMNIVRKVYGRVKKLQNENRQALYSKYVKKNKSTIDNLIIMRAIIEKQRQDHNIVCRCRKNVLTSSG